MARSGVSSTGEIAVSFDVPAAFTVHSYAQDSAVPGTAADEAVWGWANSGGFDRDCGFFWHSSSFTSGGTFSTKSGAGSYRQLNVPGSFSANTWHSVTCVSSSAGMEVFVDGVSADSNAVGVHASGTATFLGMAQEDGFSRWGGQGAEWAIWDVVLTDTEIAALGKGISAELIRPASLQLYWKAIRSSPVFDYSGNGRDGVIVTVAVSEHPPILYRSKQLIFPVVAAAPVGGRIMFSLANSGGLAGKGGIAGQGGGLAA